jgi:glycolate oxidase iron-sulfur subunit
MDPTRAVYPAPAEAPLEQMKISADVRVMADVCVKCGLCLQSCPTYRLSGIEGESPRGRIALVQGLAEGALPASGRTAEHLESCTGCLTCETVCPARVSYGELINRGRAELRERGRQGPRATRWLARLSRRPRTIGALLGLLRLTRRLGLDRVAASLGLDETTTLGRLMRRLPTRSAAAGLRPSGPAGDTRGDPVLLFTGCLGQTLDGETLRDALTVLEAAGCDVAIPAEQTCCGALDLHDGRPDEAGRLAGVNCHAFHDEAAPIVTLASGCAATLGQYGRITPVAGEPFVRRLRDLLDLVDERWDRLAVRPDGVNMRIAVFEPCSARNTAGTPTRTREILGRLPATEVTVVDTGYGCCGAAGHHFITRGQQADALLAPILAHIDEIAPDVVAVANLGCALHIAGAFQTRGSGPEVLHPVSLVARNLARTG